MNLRIIKTVISREYMTRVKKKSFLVTTFVVPIHVMEVYGIPPCKEIGIIKEYVKNAVLDGVIGNNFEEADKLMRQKASEMGLVECK